MSTRTRVIEGIVCEHARRDAKLFVEEFGEPLDPAETDWDSVAWGEALRAVRAADELTDDECDSLWSVYQETLVSETERLCAGGEDV
jgi:hypothetical protein